jgi:hypothetical protein
MSEHVVIENCTHYTYMDYSIENTLFSKGCTVFLKRISLLETDLYPESNLFYYERSFNRHFYIRADDQIATLTTPNQLEIYVIGPIFKYDEQQPENGKYEYLV